jgi:hypothetical protein
MNLIRVAGVYFCLIGFLGSLILLGYLLRKIGREILDELRNFSN